MAKEELTKLKTEPLDAASVASMASSPFAASLRSILPTLPIPVQSCLLSWTRFSSLVPFVWQDNRSASELGSVASLASSRMSSALSAPAPSRLAWDGTMTKCCTGTARRRPDGRTAPEPSPVDWLRQQPLLKRSALLLCPALLLSPLNPPICRRSSCSISSSFKLRVLRKLVRLLAAST